MTMLAQTPQAMHKAMQAHPLNLVTAQAFALLAQCLAGCGTGTDTAGNRDVGLADAWAMCPPPMRFQHSVLLMQVAATPPALAWAHVPLR